MIPWLLARPIVGWSACALAFALLLFSTASYFSQLGKTAAAERALSVTARKLDHTQAELQTCNASVENLKGSLASQNDAVAAMAEERDQAQARGAKALQDALKASRETDREIARALNMQPKSADYCEAARELETFLRGAQ